MQKIIAFIMNKRFLPLIIILTLASIFLFLKSEGRSDDDPKSRHAKVLKSVGELLEEQHYSPKKINDAFSKSVLKKFVEQLDDEKNIFLQSDISGFQKFSNVIDDEIHGKKLESFYLINDVYIQRLNEVIQLYPEFLNKPFDFSKDENINMNPETSKFPKDETERRDYWRKKMKYMVLSKYYDMLETEEKLKKDSVGYKPKTENSIIEEAREQVRKQMSRYFNTKKNHETQDENFSVFINTITGLMDPHTNYFPPVDLRSFNESMSGRFYGIGAQLKEDDGKIKITSLVSGGPAWRSGKLKENDEILKVGQGKDEPVDVTGYSVPDAVKLIRGAQKGSEVRLTVRHMDGQTEIIILLRDEINPEETRAKSAIIQGDHKIGYIYLPEFYADFERANGNRCSVDVAKEIEKLKSEHVEGIIMDLRSNGGGSLYDVVQIAGLFIKKGPICQVQGRDGNASTLSDNDERVQYEGPLAVMVDGSSASASEIFAAAIQDYKRGLIIGSTSTYGKGTVQRNIPLSGDLFAMFNNNQNNPDEMGSVKLTLQKFYRINGGATQLKGVTPDIILPDRYDYLKYREKDNTEALRWDEIKPLRYDLWSRDTAISSIISQTKSELKNNNSFNAIQSNVNWLDSFNKKPFPLQLEKYRGEQKKLKSVYKQMDEVYKLKDTLSFINNTADIENINQNEDKKEKNKQWIKARNADIFIGQTVRLLTKVIEKH